MRNNFLMILNKYCIHNFNIPHYQFYFFKNNFYFYITHNNKFVIFNYKNFFVKKLKNEILLFTLNKNKYLASVLQNTCKGFMCHYKKVLEIKGIGYKFELLKKDLLTIDIGYSHNIVIKKPESIQFLLYKNKLKIFGYNLNQVSQLAARIKLFKKIDPYKGKGVRGLGDIIMLKQGKKKKR